MLGETEFDDVVLFDVPADYADKLRAWLAPAHLAWPAATEQGFFIAAAVRDELDNLAGLLRDAETWVTESGLPYLRFILDGREYTLWARADTPAGGAAYDDFRPPH